VSLRAAAVGAVDFVVTVSGAGVTPAAQERYIDDLSDRALRYLIQDGKGTSVPGL
jgi:hypothetical protein